MARFLYDVYSKATYLIQWRSSSIRVVGLLRNLLQSSCYIGFYSLLNESYCTVSMSSEGILKIYEIVLQRFDGLIVHVL